MKVQCELGCRVLCLMLFCVGLLMFLAYLGLNHSVVESLSARGMDEMVPLYRLSGIHYVLNFAWIAGFAAGGGVILRTYRRELNRFR